MADSGQTIVWLLKDPPPDELLALEPDYDFGRYAEGVELRGAEGFEVTLPGDGSIGRVRLLPQGFDVFVPETLGGALDELARYLPKPPEGPWPTPGGTTPDPVPDRVEPPGIERARRAPLG